MQRRQPGDPDFADGLSALSYEPAGLGGAGASPRPSVGDPSPFALTTELPALDAEAPSAWLRVEQGSVDYREIPLDRPIMVIGRRLTSDVVIHDTNVSRQHARLTRLDGSYAVEDTQSSNGTFVNDEQIFGPRTLRSGDVIRIGDSVFVYRAAGGAAEPAGALGTVAPADPERWAPMTSGPERPGTLIGRETEDADPRPVVADVAAPPVRSLSSVPPVDMPPPGGLLGGDEALARAFERGGRGPSESGTLADDESAEARPGLESGAATPTAAREVLAEVSREVASLATLASRLADRVRHLEGALVADPDRLAGPADRVSSDDTVALLELRRLLRDLRSVGDPEAATAAAGLLDTLLEHPRDIELLLSISKQAPSMAVVMRQHAYLMRLAPLLDEALGRLVD